MKGWLIRLYLWPGLRPRPWPTASWYSLAVM